MKKTLLSLLTVLAVCGLSARADEPVVLLDADFSVFDEGSMESPKTIYASQITTKIPEISYASGISSAGGCLLVGPSGYIELKAFSALPTSSGCTLKVTAEVKMGDEYGGVVQLMKSYTTVSNIIVDGDEWTTVSDLAADFGYTAKLKIQPYLSVTGFYIKSLKVEYSADFIAAPQPYLPNDADGTQFTASWSKIGGATQYELDVFSIGDNDEPVYFMQNEVVKPLSVYSDPSKKVTGLDPETTYYYVVRSVNANGAKSDNSEVIEVIKCISSIDAPEATDATDITADGFTANWNAVDNAVGYQVNCFSSQVLEEPGEVSVFNEDFSGVINGSFTSLAYSGDLNTMTKQPGWLTDFSKTFAKGYYVIYPSSGVGQLATPAIDLSKNDGAFSVTIKAAAGGYGSFFTSDNTITVAIAEGDDLDHLTVIEEAEPQKITSKDFIDYTFNFTKGTADVRLLITYAQVEGNSDKLHIDEINVSQTLPAGSIVDVKLGSTTVENVTSAHIDLAMEESKSYFYTVNAIGRTVLGSGANAAIDTIMSDESNSITVQEASGVDNVAVDNENAKAWKAGDCIIGVTGSNAAVYDLSGRVLYNAAVNGACTIQLNMHGAVIVVVDNTPFKIIL
ncbi:MAG: fibronectin type III domain-containing protein [Muribaculaceae bacterium]|nr:fibronectin type III domain-containing protein [Muribaculaceae bacterium]